MKEGIIVPDWMKNTDLVRTHLGSLGCELKKVTESVSIVTRNAGAHILAVGDETKPDWSSNEDTQASQHIFSKKIGTVSTEAKDIEQGYVESLIKLVAVECQTNDADGNPQRFLSLRTGRSIFVDLNDSAGQRRLMCIQLPVARLEDVNQEAATREWLAAKIKNSAINKPVGDVSLKGWPTMPDSVFDFTFPDVVLNTGTQEISEKTIVGTKIIFNGSGKSIEVNGNGIAGTHFAADFFVSTDATASIQIGCGTALKPIEIGVSYTKNRPVKLGQWGSTNTEVRGQSLKLQASKWATGSVPDGVVGAGSNSTMGITVDTATKVDEENDVIILSIG